MSEQVAPRAFISLHDMPPAYLTLSAAARRLNEIYTQLSRLEIFLFLAASIATIPAWRYGSLNVSLASASICFGFALVIQAYLSIGRVEEAYDKAREGAENIKSLTWRFTMGAKPFDHSIESACMLFDELAVEIFHAAGGDRIRRAVKSNSSIQTSNSLMAPRMSPLADRRTIYLEMRCESLQRWYWISSQSSGRQASRTTALTAAVGIVALIGLLVRASGFSTLDVYSIAAAVGTANASWAQIQQWQRRRDEYKERASDIKAAKAIMASIWNQSDFASKVSEVEEILTGVPLSKLRLYADSVNPVHETG